MWLLIAGGVPMLFIVVFGLVAIAAAARFAWAPGDGRWSHVAALATAVGFASIAGFAADMMSVAVHVGENPEWQTSDNFRVVVLEGFGESMSPLILGFAMVAAAALVTAVGMRRAPAPA
jgi:hypothetical protein